MPVPEQDFDLLSAYLDGQLSPDERRALEVRLAEDAELRAALDDLRQTVALLHAAPRLIPPRNFTLDPAKYRRIKPWWARYGAMQTIGAFGALASAALIIIVAIAFSQNGSVPFPSSANKFSSAPPGGQGGAIALVPTITATITATITPAEQHPQADLIEGAESPTAFPTAISIAITSTPTDTINAPESTSTIPPAATRYALKSGANGGQPAPLAAQGGAPQMQNANSPNNSVAPPDPYAPMAAPTLVIATPYRAQESVATEAATEGATGSAKVFPSPSATVTATNTVTNTATYTVTATGTPSATPTAASAVTAVALAATTGPLPLPNTMQPPPEGVGVSQLLLIIGIALFVFSIMLLGLGFLGRMRNRGGG